MNFADILSVSLVLFSVIDIVGNIPVILDMKQKGVVVDSMKASVVSMGLMVAFLLAGEGILRLLGLDVQSFAVAGALILFFIGLEMILGVRFFKEAGSIIDQLYSSYSLSLDSGSWYYDDNHIT